MANNTPQEIFDAIEAQLRVIRIADGYHTDIGARFYLGDVQRDKHDRPSIAVGARNGLIDRTNESRNGRALSSKARQIDLIIEAALNGSAKDALRDGLLMLEDIEKAWAIRTGLAPAPIGSVRLLSWQVLERPDGLDATVLQILGEAEYLRA